jgi:predicted AlkP superfamily phosphohydrolase/phosphomutase
MLSGRDPGELGLYGFRNRVPGTYDLATATSASVHDKRVWDLLGEHGRRVAVLFVPPGAPPPPVRGVSAACFLHPGGDAPWTFPRSLGADLEARFGPYVADVVDVRRAADDATLLALVLATRQRFQIARHVWETEQPDAMFVVDTAPDRLHHGYLHHLDRSHPHHDPHDARNDVVAGYYAMLDEQVGALVACAGADTTVIVASAHGARPMLGSVRVDEWLLREGWLALRGARPDVARPLRMDDVDWPRTRAWAEGGYHARVMLNVRGREPEGVIAPRDVDAERARLASSLRSLAASDPRIGSVEMVDPLRAYRAARGEPPDLMAFFGDLSLRASAAVGGPTALFGERDDRGAGLDAANHAWDGIFAMAGPTVRSRGVLDGLSLFDVGPTVLAHAGLAAPDDWLGRVIG